MNGPLIGYDVTYAGILYSDHVFQFVAPYMEVDSTATQSVILPAGNNNTVTGLMPNYFYLLFIRAGNSEGYTLPAELNFTLPPTSKLYLYKYLST